MTASELHSVLLFPKYHIEIINQNILNIVSATHPSQSGGKIRQKIKKIQKHLKFQIKRIKNFT